MKCIGFAEFEGRCGNEAWPSNHHWCERCNELRMEAITKQFQEITDRMKEVRDES